MQEPLDQFNIPILFITFTRFETTKKVFESIKAIKPAKLYISSDGPRENIEGESEKVEFLRNYILDNIDWECQVSTNFQKVNLGCKYNPQSSITWFFEQEKMGIILEDDVVPSQSFFAYCKELLIRYERDLRVWGISGANMQHKVDIEDSYYFSDFFMTWGWASWSSRWQKHLELMKQFDNYVSSPLIKHKLKNRTANKKMLYNAIISYNNQLDAWDYLWIFSCFCNNGLIATPNANLCENIGFGEGATHTSSNSYMRISKNELDFPLKHPLIIYANKKIDEQFFSNVFGWISFRKKLFNKKHILKFINARISRHFSN